MSFFRPKVGDRANNGTIVSVPEKNKEWHECKPPSRFHVEYLIWQCDCGKEWIRIHTMDWGDSIWEWKELRGWNQMMKERGLR